MNSIKCCVARSATGISTELSSTTQLSGNLTGVLAIHPKCL